MSIAEPMDLKDPTGPVTAKENPMSTKIEAMTIVVEDNNEIEVKAEVTKETAEEATARDEIEKLNLLTTRTRTAIKTSIRIGNQYHENETQVGRRSVTKASNANMG